MRTKFNIFRTLSTALRSREWGRGALSSPSTTAESPLASPSTASPVLATKSRPRRSKVPRAPERHPMGAEAREAQRGGSDRARFPVIISARERKPKHSWRASSRNLIFLRSEQSRAFVGLSTHRFMSKNPRSAGRDHDLISREKPHRVRCGFGLVERPADPAQGAPTRPPAHADLPPAGAAARPSRRTPARRGWLKAPRMWLASAGPSGARTQGEALGGTKGKPEDAAPRSVRRRQARAGGFEPASKHHLRRRVAFSAAGALVAAASLALAATPASALSKNTFSTSFSGEGGYAVSNPTAVAVDPSTGDVYVANSPVNERQAIAVKAIGGTFTLSFKGQTTEPIAFNAQPEQGAGSLAAALGALSTVGAKNVTVTGSPGAYTVEFLGSLGAAAQPQLTADPSQLTGTHSVTIATSRPAIAGADVEKFDSSGHFLLMFGSEVNATTHGDLCTASETCQPGAPGTAPGSFADPEYLAVDSSPGGEADLYVGDHGAATPGQTGLVYAEASVQKFDPQGNLRASWGEGGRLEGADGFHFSIGASGNQSLAGLAVDPSGNLFVFAERRFFEFAQGGGATADFPQAQSIEQFDRPELFGFALDPEDNLYSISSHRPPPTAVYKTPPRGEAAERVAFSPAQQIALDSATRDLYALTSNSVEHFSAFCISAEQCKTPVDTFGAGHLNEPRGLAVDPATGAVYVADTGDRSVAVFTAVPYLPDATATATPLTPTTEGLAGTADPAGAPKVTSCSFQYGADAGTYNLGSVACNPAPPLTTKTNVAAASPLEGLQPGTTYHYRLLLEDENGPSSSYDQAFTTLPAAPQIGAESVSQVHADAALLHTQINPGGGEAAYHTSYDFEYVTQEQFEETKRQEGFAGAEKSPRLDPAPPGPPRALRCNSARSRPAPPTTTGCSPKTPPKRSTGADRTFTTLPFSQSTEPCPNAHVRQQTGAAGLLDCRAYELVSAANTGGYDVESDLIPGQAPFAGYPEAQGRVLYGVHDGGIPGTGDPTNRGVDPYLATRGPGGWIDRIRRHPLQRHPLDRSLRLDPAPKPTPASAPSPSAAPNSARPASPTAPPGSRSASLTGTRPGHGGLRRSRSLRQIRRLRRQAPLRRRHPPRLRLHLQVRARRKRRRRTGDL